MKFLKNKSVFKESLDETIQSLEAHLAELYREVRDIENALYYLKVGTENDILPCPKGQGI